MIILKDLYLLNLTINGVKNIDSQITLDFYKKTIDKKFDPSKYRVKAIYGENGTGKSAIVTAVSFLKNFLGDEDYLSDKHSCQILSEIMNKKTNKMHLEFELLSAVFKDHVVLHYILEIEKSNDQINIVYESLESRSATSPNTTYKTVYIIENGEIKTLMEESGHDNTLIINQTMNLLSKSTFISVFVPKLLVNDKLAQYSFCDYFVAIFGLSFTLITVLDDSDKHTNYQFNNNTELKMKQTFNAFTNTKHNNFSLNPDSIVVPIDEYDDFPKKISKLCSFIQLFKPSLMDIKIDKKIIGENYICELIMQYEDYEINSEFESTGIRKIINLFDSLDSASSGAIVFIDELDSNINDVYLCKIIEYFMYYGKGQLCFTTHNLDPMNILSENKYSITFLSSYGTVVNWKSHGNASPEKFYKNGMIEDSPFNIDSMDFLGILGGDEND